MSSTKSWREPCADDGNAIDDGEESVADAEKWRIGPHRVATLRAMVGSTVQSSRFGAARMTSWHCQRNTKTRPVPESLLLIWACGPAESPSISRGH